MVFSELVVLAPHSRTPIYMSLINFKMRMPLFHKNREILVAVVVGVCVFAPRFRRRHNSAANVGANAKHE
jgi:hypothetical protein